MNRRNLLQSAALFLATFFLRLSGESAFASAPVETIPQLPHMPTLMEQAAFVRAHGQDLRADTIEQYAAHSDLMRAMRFMDVVGGAYAYTQEGQLPGIAFRGYDEPYANGVGIVNVHTESLRISGGDLDVDMALIKTYGAHIRDQQNRMKVKALSLFLTDQLVNGDSEADPRAFDGLRKRIVGDQLFHAHGALRRKALDEAINSVDAPTHLLLGDAMRKHLSEAGLLKKTGYKSYQYTTADNEETLDVIVTHQSDTGADIIGFNEFNKTTSIYVLSIGDAGVCVIQHDIMEVVDLGEVLAKPVLRTRIEWLVSLVIFSGRAAARLQGIRDAPVRT